MKPHQNTSWHAVGEWYNKSVGGRGSYFHEHVVLPGVMRLLNLTPSSSVLDVACGQGVLARRIPQDIPYVGIDAAPSLISFAQKQDKNPKHRYIVTDVTKPLPITETCTHAAIILALQNIEDPAAVFRGVVSHLVPGGKFVIVLNHPCFRIPRQSSWEIDPQSKLQYRRVNRYMSPLKIPITMHPGEKTGSLTWSFHEPISAYSRMLTDAHFVIERLEEWVSDKESVGKASKMENRSRAEFPLFLAISARLD